MTKWKFSTLLFTISLMIVGTHYLVFLDRANDERKCRQTYNFASVEAARELSLLMKDTYENQNRLTVEYATATARTAPARDNGEFNAQVQEVFAAHYARLAELDKRFAEIKFPAVPSC